MPASADTAGQHAEAPLMASSNKPAPVDIQHRGVVARREKDAVPTQHVDRQDSDSSWRSAFQGRTDTISSMSTASSITEPSSPVAATFHDEPTIVDYASPSSSRHSSFYYRTGPSRALSIALTDLDKSSPFQVLPPLNNTPTPIFTPTPRPRRLQDLTMTPVSHRGSFGRHPGLSLSHTGSAPGSRRGSNQSAAPYSGLAAAHPGHNTNLGIADNDSGRSLSPPTSPELQAEQDTAVKVEAPDMAMLSRVGSIADEPLAPMDDNDDDDGGITPVDTRPNNPHARDTPACKSPREEQNWIPDDDTSDSMVEDDAVLRLEPRDRLVQDVCDRLLRDVFGVELKDLDHTGAAAEAYKSVSYCLDELSHVVPASALPNPGDFVHEASPGDTGSTTTRYFGAGGDAGAGAGRSNKQDTGNGNGGQKRPLDNGDNDPNNNGSSDGNGPGGGGGPGGKKPKLMSEPQDQNLSCPFRKRNPVRFNVRDHQSCAVQSFPDISQLKRHVKNFHKPRSASVFACPRCKQDMKTKEAYEDHLAVPNNEICTPQEVPPSPDPESGITSRIEDLLNGRKANSKIDTWDSLLRTLFPLDLDPLDPEFVPPIELDEVWFEFQDDLNKEELRRRMQQEEMRCLEDDGDVRDSVERRIAVCNEHIEHVFDKCRAKTNNLSGQPRRKRGPATSKQAATASPEDQRYLTLPRNIPKKQGGGSPSNGSSLSSSLDTNSNGSWVKIGQSLMQAPASGVEYPVSMGGDAMVAAATGGVGPTWALSTGFGAQYHNDMTPRGGNNHNNAYADDIFYHQQHHQQQQQASDGYGGHRHAHPHVHYPGMPVSSYPDQNVPLMSPPSELPLRLPVQMPNPSLPEAMNRGYFPHGYHAVTEDTEYDGYTSQTQHSMGSSGDGSDTERIPTASRPARPARDTGGSPLNLSLSLFARQFAPNCN
ncbi:hypothetical protein B0T26DRAFT_750602 [Lasiosphaeria miniovina]|uniref:C2H2-type domain-containing protein n=1 Tax=Lasiosphaeria miniovina TaxID=1954250 RepID=A0AA40AWK7_9PEZI|nr:uncharacterized protein B0T26DRAFT_750602 [Lasiosphaeria miniovina]KAK0723323.1 hypothetical protein B0T26DRAFT_750602 [Lasiosphaeria miniovina]